MLRKANIQTQKNELNSHRQLTVKRLNFCFWGHQNISLCCSGPPFKIVEYKHEKTPNKFR
ncbi:hypothetical protein ABE13_07365 [Bacillus wiedmannii]|nr:hypothetical protein [Bacillus wiedmannii]